MRTAHVAPALALFALVGCRNEGSFTQILPSLELEVLTPTYGEFLGDDPAAVTGRVQPLTATVLVEGVQVPVAEDGTFSASIPVDHAYRIVDVEASVGEHYDRVRVPVFRGHDPTEAWPGGLTMRLTPAGMERLGVNLGAVIDATGWADQLHAAIPSVDLDFLWLGATSVTHDPTVVELLPAEDGMDMLLSLQGVDLNLAAELDLFGSLSVLPVTVGYDRIGIGARIIPSVDEAGLVTLGMGEPRLVMRDPVVTVAGADSWILELILSGVGMLLEPVGGFLLDIVTEELGIFELGGPYVFETDLLGMPVEARLSDVFGDLGGLGLGLGLGLGEPALVGTLPLPVPTTTAPDVHAQLALHEGLMHVALTDGVLDMLTQDLELPGAIGEFLGTAARNLPGGEDAPTETEGWCLSVLPMDAQVVRLQDGVMPWAVLYLPDVIVDLGYRQGGECTSWLVTSLAFEVGVDVRAGQVLSIDMNVPEGAVLEYGADPGWEEEEVVSGLAGFMGGALGLLGGQLEIDLGDLLGGLGGGAAGGDPLLDAMGDLDLRIVDSQPSLDGQGQPVEGLYTVSLTLWRE